MKFVAIMKVKNLPGRRDVRPSCFSVLRTQTTEAGEFIQANRAGDQREVSIQL
jgi:hypothetical protein